MDRETQFKAVLEENPLGYLLVCAAGLTFTYRNWRSDKASLLAEVQQMKAQLMVDEADDSGEAATN